MKPFNYKGLGVFVSNVLATQTNLNVLKNKIMVKNCINLKQKLDRTLFCKKKNKLIKISECNTCKYKEYNVSHNNIKPKKSKKITKLERNRFSILTNDLDHCIICGTKKDNLHEVFFGSNRSNSMKYGLVIPLCVNHHLEMHKNKEWQDYWHRKGQLAFIEYYHDLDFLEIFKKNYI